MMDPVIDIPDIDDSVTRWHGEAADAARPLVVLVHGYGSDENDLAGLAPLLPAEYAYASVRAPLAMPFPSPGYAWYPLEGDDARDPAVLTAATERLISWIDGLGRTGPVGLAGFSQGGALSVHAMRLRPGRFAFAANLSGYALPGADLPGDAELAELRPPVFWGRGTADAVIPEALVVHTTDWLPGHADLVGRIYPGLGHAVSPDEISDLSVFLTRQLPV
ncbi:MAG: alpha/beta hydrolase [Microbacterium sp.]